MWIRKKIQVYHCQYFNIKKEEIDNILIEIDLAKTITYLSFKKSNVGEKNKSIKYQ